MIENNLNDIKLFNDYAILNRSGQHEILREGETWNELKDLYTQTKQLTQLTPQLHGKVIGGVAIYSTATEVGVVQCEEIQLSFLTYKTIWALS